MERRFIFYAFCALSLVFSGLLGCRTSDVSLRRAIALPATGNILEGLGGAGIDSPVDDKEFLDAEDLSIEIPPAPNSFDLEAPQYEPMSLRDTIAAGMQNSKIIRDLGGNTLRNPDGVASVFDQAIAFTDPQTGEEAALSEFDARFFSQTFFEKNDRVVNNQFLATDGTLVQDLGEIRTGVSKRAINGGLFSVSTIQEYDFNNSIGNRFGNPSSSWSNAIQGDFRQPLLRGRDALFNRIAGPNVDDGVFNGVLISKTRTDISAADFKTAVRNYIADVENAYWDLYYAYRDLEAKKMARDNALESWRRIKALGNEKKAGGEADKEGQAREQYFRFEAEVNDALYGRVADATRSNNGSGGGTFRPSPGVRISERRLRLLIGMPANGAELIRPSDEPDLAPISFDWSTCVSQSLTSRPEVYRQLQRIKRVKMEMLATRASLMPQLDVIGRYTVRGFGKNLAGSTDLEPSDGAVENTFDLNNQEWQLGLDLNIPIGYRRANASLRNTQNRLARERQLLREQKRQIINDLSDAFQDVERARKSHELQYNRLDSALSQFAAVQETNLQKKAPFNLVLEAQRRVLDAQIQYYRSQVEYTLAVRNVHFEKGTLFEYTSVQFVGDNLLDSGAALASSESQIMGTTTGKELSYVISDSDMNGFVVPTGSMVNAVPESAFPSSTRETFVDAEGLALPTSEAYPAPTYPAPAPQVPASPAPTMNFQSSEPALESFSSEQLLDSAPN